MIKFDIKRYRWLDARAEQLNAASRRRARER